MGDGFQQRFCPKRLAVLTKDVGEVWSLDGRKSRVVLDVRGRGQLTARRDSVGVETFQHQWSKSCTRGVNGGRPCGWTGTNDADRVVERSGGGGGGSGGGGDGGGGRCIGKQGRGNVVDGGGEVTVVGEVRCWTKEIWAQHCVRLGGAGEQVANTIQVVVVSCGGGGTVVVYSDGRF